jgi:hypothetical protein
VTAACAATGTSTGFASAFLAGAGAMRGVSFFGALTAAAGLAAVFFDWLMMLYSPKNGMCSLAISRRCKVNFF